MLPSQGTLSDCPWQLFLLATILCRMSNKPQKIMDYYNYGK